MNSKNIGDPTRGRPQRSAAEDYRQWRARQLVRAGFETDLAAPLAADPSIDLHALIELVENGCPPLLAARILAPLDDGRGPR